ncbi:MAG: DNA-directed RNA polymerase subunit beta [Deltaproteobacteria bacterium RBG_13_61_14]|nr:MAG: DNA-directed RNA polymerase subunit beta [Deltaproteobacteria bacterium RBG_13_61_14]
MENQGNGRPWRRSFSKIPKIVEIPNLIAIQRQSYEKFLQRDVAPEQRGNEGLQAVFSSVFPIKDFNETASLEFVSYRLEEPKFDVDECRQRWMTFAAPIQVRIRLVVWDLNEETGLRTMRDVKEQEVYFGEIPLMTEQGTFIINGTERVIVSQLHRAPGVFFDNDRGKTHSSGKVLYFARIIPYRGSWIDFEFDHRDILYVRIDRRRKLPATVLLRALGYTTEELLNFFYQTEKIYLEDKKITKAVNEAVLEGQVFSRDVRDSKTREILGKKGKKIKKAHLRRFRESGITQLQLEDEDLVGRVLAHDIINRDTGEVLFEANEELDQNKLDVLRQNRIGVFEVIFFDNLRVSSSLRDTLLQDKSQSAEDAKLEIYRWLRPGDPPTPKSANALFENLFFNPERYDLAKVGRLKLNYKLGLTVPLDHHTLTKEDIMMVVQHLLELKDGRGDPDDIDHLGNRRVRAVGELLENQFRIGLVRMARAIKERMSFQEVEMLMPHDLVNSKPVSAVIKEFFGSSQLSQFMDQTNPLSEVTHKRRLSALGPGGLTRERAGFEVRDVHATHYGRVCPVETPEGPNIGLIASLSTYARVNEYGFIETPYRLVKEGTAQEEVMFLSALEEEGNIIAQANAPLDKKGKFVNETVSARRSGEFIMATPEQVTLMDVSPNQLVSAAASLIPFLEHDDANRALMGSNMQRQAVPLLQTESPLIGTGVEKVVAEDSGAAMLARRSGTVASVDATRIVIGVDEPGADKRDRGVDIYNLMKYQRSNQGTCLNQRPAVHKGQQVQKGEVIADGPATAGGELALGRNVLVAFLPWGGYNFEDSILVSERLIKKDLFTSIHIEEFECISRDTKLGKEEITRDIPNVGEEALKDLDESGIIRIGAEVKAGDILAGKITPKSVTQLSPEEKLLRAIFGEKAGDVRDSSSRVPPGVEGTVISVRVFSRKGVSKDERAKMIKDSEIQKLLQDKEDEVRIIQEGVLRKVAKLLHRKKTAQRLVDLKKDKVLVKKDEDITEELLQSLPLEQWPRLQIEGKPELEVEVGALVDRALEQMDLVEQVVEEKIRRLQRDDDLPPGVIKMVKVFVATKRKLSVGDKMAGRHGNKGVLSRILPEEDMPYLEDGTPVDIVLNPLGVPSRMNVGQILETHLGWAAQGLGDQIQEMLDNHFSPEALRKKLKEIYDAKDVQKWITEAGDEEIRELAGKLRSGIYISSPVFDGASETEIKDLLVKAHRPVVGQAILFDGRTGEPFHHKITVGTMYIMKLHHLVDDKIHARSIGPYSLVTQQPLGGKAQFGGQRLGEMEVWAIEAYGAAYILQEFLTVKSDDIAGRTRMYEAIVKGRHEFEAGLPESFNVLIKELQSLALDVQLLRPEG